MRQPVSHYDEHDDGVELVGEGREHPRVTVPERDGEGSGGGVDVVEARLVEDPGPLGRHGHRQRTCG